MYIGLHIGCLINGAHTQILKRIMPMYIYTISFVFFRVFCFVYVSFFQKIARSLTLAFAIASDIFVVVLSIYAFLHTHTHTHASAL